MPTLIDLTGQKFNSLTVLNRAPSRNDKRVWWTCKCDCGNIIECRGDHLKAGNTKNCGHKNKDLTGMRFTKLTVIKDTGGRNNNNEKIWECLCDCGNTTYVNTSALNSGHTRSCGCLISVGEFEIIKLLQDNNIPYIYQYTVNSNEKKYRYDFAILNNNNEIIKLIEFDGEQHYIEKSASSNWKLTLSEQQEVDSIKDEIAKHLGLPLIRIPYTKRGAISLEDIL